MDSKILFSTGFLHELSIEELYIVTTHWLSDISFYELEIGYFNSLIVHYFLPPLEGSDSILIKSFENHFHSLISRKDYLKTGIIQHQNHLSDLLNESQIENEAHFNVLHSDLEEKLYDFIKTLRQVKLEFFYATNTFEK